jgi:hypothetical protein
MAIEVQKRQEDKPDLMQAIKGRGSLTTASQQELASRAQGMGVQTPTTPMTAAQIGATPDQAKMAGTPQQFAGALKMAQEGIGPTDQATARRQEGPRTELAMEESAREATSRAMQGVGQIGNRVQEVVSGAFNELVAQQTVLPQVDLEAVDGSVDVQSNLETLIDSEATAEEREQALLALNAALGRDLYTRLSEQEILSYYAQTDDSAIGATAKAALGQGITMDQVFGLSPDDASQALGMTPADMAALLGVDEETLQGMTLQQFQEAIDSKIMDMTGEIEGIQYALANPNISAQEKVELRRRLRDLGGTGQRTIETELQDLQDAIDAGDQIEFGGETMTVEQLLGDDRISETIARFLTSPEDSEWAKRFAEAEPQLAEWIEAQRAGLEEAMKQMEMDISGFETKQAAREALPELMDGTKLSSASMQALMGKNWDRMSVDAAAPPPILAMAKTNDTIGKELKKLEAAGDMAVLKELASLNADQVAGLQIGKAGGSWDLWNKSRAVVSALKNKSSDAALDQMFGKGASSTIKANLDLAAQLKKLGVNVPGSDLDKTGDGKFDGVDSFINSVKSLSQANLPLAKVAQGGLSAVNFGDAPQNPMDILGASPSVRGKVQQILDDINTQGRNPPRVILADVRKLAKDISTEDLSALINMGLISQDMANKAVQAEVDKHTPDGIAQFAQGINHVAGIDWSNPQQAMEAGGIDAMAMVRNQLIPSIGSLKERLGQTTGVVREHLEANIAKQIAQIEQIIASIDNAVPKNKQHEKILVRHADNSFRGQESLSSIIHSPDRGLNFALSQLRQLL